MTKELLNDWFDNKFCGIYQNLTQIESARRLLHRYQPEEKTLEDILQYVRADNKRRKVARDRKEFYPPPPNCFTFFKDSRWMDKITETAQVYEREEQERQKCPQCKNMEYFHVQNKKRLCSWHFTLETEKVRKELNLPLGPTPTDILRQEFKRNGYIRGKDEGHDEHISRLRAITREKARGVGKIHKEPAGGTKEPVDSVSGSTQSE